MNDITVLIASYNRLHLLKKSVESALSQDYSNFHVLVVDDGSNNETKQWLKKQQEEHPRLSVFFRPHLGVSAVRTFGVIQSRTDLICILDSDDILLPGALKDIAGVFEQKPDVDLVYVKNRHYFPNGSTKIRNYPRFSSNRRMVTAMWLMPTVPFKHSGTTFKRKTCINLDAYDMSLPCKIDIDLFLKFLTRNKTLHLITDKPLVGFHYHEASISANRILGIRVWLKLIDRYGPESRVLKFVMKCVKTFNEFLKLVFLEILKFKLFLDKTFFDGKKT